MFAIPGRVNDPKSKGCLNLIKTDRARLITCGNNIATWLAWESKSTERVVQKQLFIELNEKEQEIVDCLNEIQTLDSLALKIKKPVAQIASLLMELELKGVVRSLAGKRFEQI